MSEKLQSADQIVYIEHEGTLWGPWEVVHVYENRVTSLIEGGLMLDIPIERVFKVPAYYRRRHHPGGFAEGRHFDAQAIKRAFYSTWGIENNR